MRQGAQMFFIVFNECSADLTAPLIMGSLVGDYLVSRLPVSFPKRGFAIACASALLLFAVAWGWRAAVARRLDPALSPVARRVIRSVPGRMQEERSAGIATFARKPVQAAALLEEAEFAITEIAMRLGVEPPAHPIRILLVPEKTGWDVLIRAIGSRPDGLAVSSRDEVFLREGAVDALRPDRLAHELVHIVMRDAYGTNVPLWLDEGLAGHLGVAVSRDYRSLRGRRLTGEWAGFPDARAESLAELTQRRELPEDPAAARFFYRAAQELVTLIENRIGTARLPAYVADVAGGMDWREALDARLDGSPLSSADLEDALRRQVALPQRF